MIHAGQGRQGQRGGEGARRAFTVKLDLSGSLEMDDVVELLSGTIAEDMVMGTAGVSVAFDPRFSDGSTVESGSGTSVWVGAGCASKSTTGLFSASTAQTSYSKSSSSSTTSPGPTPGPVSRLRVSANSSSSAATATTATATTTATTTDALDSPLPQKDLQSFIKLGSRLGSGAFGTVYAGMHLGTGHQVAVKVLNKPNQNSAAAEMAKIRKEVDLLRELQHPNIVAYYGTWEDDKALYICLDFVEGGSLAAKVKEYGPLPEPLAAMFVSQVLDGLAFLHSRSVVHRDIKGANLLLSKSGHVLLADFGIASSASLDKTMHSDIRRQMVGTPCYIAPEIVSGQGARPASDVYSLGATICELVSGAPPFYESNNVMRICYLTVTTPTPVPPSVTPALADLLRATWEKDPDQRITVAALGHHPWVSAPHAVGPRASLTESIKIAHDLFDAPHTVSSVSSAAPSVSSAAASSAAAAPSVAAELDAFLASLIRDSHSTDSEDTTLTMEGASSESQSQSQSQTQSKSKSKSSSGTGDPEVFATAYVTALDDSFSWSSDE